MMRMGKVMGAGVAVVRGSSELMTPARMGGEILRAFPVFFPSDFDLK